MTLKIEHRGLYCRNPLNFRAAEDGSAPIVEGYAAVFGEETEIGGYFREVIAPGAFTEAIGRDDVVFVYNHDDDTVMARTGSGTLDLEEDAKGLKIRAELDPEDPDVARVLGKMRRGDLSQMSFAFWVDVEEWDDTGDLPLRTVKQARLHDVSVVTKPAYEGTEIGVRSLAAFRKSHRQENFSATRRRLRMKQNLEIASRRSSENG